MLGCKPETTPINPNHKLGTDPSRTPVDKGQYQRLVGKLIYLSHTRPDIAYAIGLVSQFMHASMNCHMEAVTHILRYLKHTLGKGLIFEKHNHYHVEAYTDVDWGSLLIDRRSTSGYCTLVAGNLVTWKGKKHVVSRFSAEAEFRAMALGICELMWLNTLLKELHVKVDEPMRLYCDNKAAISIAHNLVQHDRTKHVEIDQHFIKENIDKGVICMPFVASKSQLADVFTKALPSNIYSPLIDKLRMLDIFEPA